MVKVGVRFWSKLAIPFRTLGVSDLQKAFHKSMAVSRTQKGEQKEEGRIVL